MHKEKRMQELPEGHFNEKLEGPFMVSIINTVRELKGGFVEIGSLFGKSSVIIGRKVAAIGGQLTCIDVWGECEYELKEEIGEAIKYYPARPKNSLEIFEGNVRRFGLQDVIVPMQNRAEAVFQTWETPLRFVFVDGCHEYEFVRRDALWKKFLVNRGIIAFHDYHTPWQGVRKAVDEAMDNDTDFLHFGDCHTTKAFMRMRNGERNGC